MEDGRDVIRGTITCTFHFFIFVWEAPRSFLAEAAPRSFLAGPKIDDQSYESPENKYQILMEAAADLSADQYDLPDIESKNQKNKLFFQHSSSTVCCTSCGEGESCLR